MFNHAMTIEKRFERLLGTFYHMDVLDEEFIETLQKKLLAECKDKMRENIYRRIEEQTTRDRMLEACGYKIADLEDLSKRLGKRKKKLKRIMKAIPHVVTPEKEEEEEQEALQRMAVDKEQKKESEELAVKKLPLWYKVARVNEMDDDKTIDELYKMADSIVWRKDMSEEIPEIESTDETENIKLQVGREKRVSEALSITSETESEVSTDDERSEEEEPKVLPSGKDVLVESAAAADEKITSVTDTKEQPPMDAETIAALVFDTNKTSPTFEDETQEESYPGEEPSTDVKEEKVLELQANGGKEQIEITTSEEKSSLQDSSEVVSEVPPQDSSGVISEILPQDSEVISEVPPQDSEIVSEIPPSSISTLESQPLELPAEHEVSQVEAEKEIIPTTDVEIEIEQKEEIPSESASKINEIEIKQEESSATSEIPSFDTILAREAQKFQDKYQDETPPIEDIVIAAVTERVSLVEEERMNKTLSSPVRIQDDQDTKIQADIKHLQPSDSEKEADTQSADTYQAENKSLEGDEQGMEEDQSTNEHLSSPHNAQEDSQANVERTEGVVDPKEETKDHFENEE